MKIYVGNLSFDTTESELRDIFTAHGEVNEVTMITDRDTGRPRGFGFIEMRSDQEAKAAIEGLNGNDVGGRSITVNEARPRAERPAGGGNRW